jgi:hypothetical protein
MGNGVMPSRTAGGARKRRQIIHRPANATAPVLDSTLWLAWDKAVFWVVLAVGCGAVVAVFLLVRLSPEDRL